VGLTFVLLVFHFIQEIKKQLLFDNAE